MPLCHAICALSSSFPPDSLSLDSNSETSHISLVTSFPRPQVDGQDGHADLATRLEAVDDTGDETAQLLRSLVRTRVGNVQTLLRSAHEEQVG